MEGFLPYEGAGFLLKYNDRYILGVRIKKPEDKDQTPEVEYAGGKVEAADGGDPSVTAHNELIEELGMDILDDNWRERARIMHTFQPFSKKWIHCFEYSLNDREYGKLLTAAINLKNWDPSEKRDFSALTGRKEPSRKALAEIVTTSVNDFQSLIRAFSAIPKSENRMGDAKKFNGKLSVISLDGGNARDYRVRAFNMVIFEEHFQ